MKRTVSFALLSAAVFALSAENYRLTAPETPKQIVEGKLNLGGVNPQGGTIAVNSYYMSIDGKPVIPVLGEFHYSRYPREQWEEEIVKMKAGGVNVLPTYVFWALHEPREGEFHWEGNLDLHHFLELCRKHDMPVVIRIGPFCHGEIRSGAIPEWIFAKPLEIRSNDPEYLKYVRALYAEIAKQMDGFYYKDGGPIIGCQIENEMQHSASPWAITYPGEETDYTAASWNAQEAAIGVEGNRKQATRAEIGDAHMRTLLQIAQESGIVTPLYTATGWGNAAVIGHDALPVTSAYTYPFWQNPPRMSPFMMFKDLHKEPDYSPVRYNPEDYPSFCAEMGAGIQMIYNSRPIVTAKAAEALMIRTLGSGCNGIGYYMYHGGSTPCREGQNAFMSDEPMGVPKISYDFQAPLGEFGLEGLMYRNLRLIHTFLADFQERLAPMETVLPDDWQRMTPDNRDDLRYAARMKDGKGFLFVVNFQDHDNGRHDQQATVTIDLGKETIRIPVTLPKDESAILPFNFDMDGTLLKYATAQPLMRIMDGKTPHYFFFAPDGVQPEYVFANGKTLRPKPGLKSTFAVKGVKVTTLTRQQALDAIKVDGRLLITKATVLPVDGGADLLMLGENCIDYVLYPSKAGFATQQASVAKVEPQYSWHQRGERRAYLHVDSLPADNVQEYFLCLDYVADVAMAFVDGRLCQDEFYHGAPWTIGLKRYGPTLRSQDMTFYFRPLKDMAFLHRDLPAEALPDFSSGPVCKVNRAEVIPEYKIHINIPKTR